LLPLKLLISLKKRVRRFPKIYDPDLLLEMFLRTFVAVERAFLFNRSSRLIERLACIQYHFYKKTESKKEEPRRRKIVIKFFQILQSDGTRVFSIAIGLNQLHPNELLEEKHIYRALSSLIPGIEIIPDSFYSCSDRKKTFLFCYLEIKKLRGKNLTSKDIDLLRKKLPLELRLSIQTLSSSLLFTYNEEVIYKNAIQLAKEFKSKNDLPQVAIFFQNHVDDTLHFSIVLVKARNQNQSDFQQLGALPSSTKLNIQKIISFGLLQKKEIKEAILFSLEIEHALFLRKNWSVDLNQARNYVVKIIEQLFGQFRDYNGGLLSQQNKQLEQIKKSLRVKYENYSSFMEEVFAFNPPSFQALISTSKAKQLFSFVISFMKKEKSSEKVVIEEKKRGDSVFVLFKINSVNSLNFLIDEIKNFQQEISSIGYSHFEFEGEHYLCFLDLSSQPQINIKAHFENTLRNKIEDRSLLKEQKILRLNFQEGDPPSLNPHIAIDQICRCLGKGLFEQLTRLNGQGIPEPAAAREIKISPCQTIYTFILKKHCWSNGEGVSAYDFERAWKSAITPDSNCLRSDLFYIIKNARDAHHGLKSLSEVKLKAINDKTLVVELEYPAFYFLHLLSQPMFSPIYKGGEEPYYFSGPFLLKEWKHNRFLHLTANPYYWDKKNVKLKDVIITMHRDSRLIKKLFEQEELDWEGEPFNIPIDNMASQQGIHHKKKVDQFYWIYLNTRSFPLSSPNIRKALACAINRKELGKVFKGKPLFFNSFLTSPDKKKVKWDGNRALALSFFNKGLRELKITKENFPKITLFWSFEAEEGAIRLIQEQIESTLGIKIELKSMPWKQLSYLLDKREFQSATCFRTSPYFYPRSYLELFRESSNLYNSSQWENPTYKAAIDRALQSFHEPEREQCLEEAEQMFLDEMPVIPLLVPAYQFSLSPVIKKFAIASNGDVDLKLIEK
jgi:oligopeptide transport system substrate-binding protein